MRLRVLENERFSCQSCTSCCRNWFVELMPGEKDRIEMLAWPADDPLHGQPVTIEHRGKTFLVRRGDGACLFLNERNGLCRIHEQFGMAAKPLGCRVFPFQIAPTFPGEASVIARFDCPTVRKNIGAAHGDELPNLKRYAVELGAAAGFDQATCCLLERQQIEAVRDFLLTMLSAFDRGSERALFIVYLCQWLSQVNVDELDRPLLAKSFAGLRQRVQEATGGAVSHPNRVVRMTFRTLLGLYLRRDEDVLNGRAGRMSRMSALAAIVLGFGSFRGLGLAHPPGKLRKARLFKTTVGPPDLAGFTLFWRMVRNRLESFQFMGPANSHRNFLDGLRSLALLYPLVLAAAKYSAANRGSRSIEAEDVDYAVPAIEHSFGRLAVLSQPWVRPMETLLLEPQTFARLVCAV